MASTYSGSSAWIRRVVLFGIAEDLQGLFESVGFVDLLGRRGRALVLAAYFGVRLLFLFESVRFGRLSLDADPASAV